MTKRRTDQKNDPGLEDLGTHRNVGKKNMIFRSIPAHNDFVWFLWRKSILAQYLDAQLFEQTQRSVNQACLLMVA